mmetsp:Transcript_2707/g.6093  ORF Transcript_2707/g.6093 Transcript_2707/m.6093 type:complete len:214 (-) Transcript_2707:26-667(-)
MPDKKQLVGNLLIGASVLEILLGAYFVANREYLAYFLDDACGVGGALFGSLCMYYGYQQYVFVLRRQQSTLPLLLTCKIILLVYSLLYGIFMMTRRRADRVWELFVPLLGYFFVGIPYLVLLHQTRDGAQTAKQNVLQVTRSEQERGAGGGVAAIEMTNPYSSGYGAQPGSGYSGGGSYAGGSYAGAAPAYNSGYQAGGGSGYNAGGYPGYGY